MTSPRARLVEVVATELAQPVPTVVRGIADAVRQKHADAALGVLFYGSCLRKPETLLPDSLLDFYLLVDRYQNAYRSSTMALANRILPPNVFYLEAAGLRCKYAVISLDQFLAGMQSSASGVSLWARFA